MNLQWLHVLLVLLLGFGTKGVFAWDIGITKDPSDHGFTHWSLVLEFSDENANKLQTDDAQLTAYARKAYVEMFAQGRSDDLDVKTQIPVVMTAMIVKNRLYLASSGKGQAFIYTSEASVPDRKISEYTCEQVRLVLEQCQTQNMVRTSKDDAHVNDANCGEIMAAQHWCTDPANAGLALKDMGARAASWGRRRPSDPNSPTGVYTPCEYAERQCWGCQSFFVGMDILWVSDKTLVPAPNLPDFEPEKRYKTCFFRSLPTVQ